MAQNHLDCRDLKCPMPIVRLAQAVKELASGEELVVEATDPAFPADVRAWAEMTGHSIVDIVEGPVPRVVVRVQ